MRLSENIARNITFNLSRYHLDRQLEMLGNCDSIISTLAWCYNSMKEIPRLETLDKEEKIEYWEASKKYTKEKYRLDFCKALIVIVYLWEINYGKQ